MLTLTVLAGLLATQPTLGSAGKIAYVDMAQALNDVNEGQAAKVKLKKDFEAKQKKLDKAQKKLQQKKASFDKKKAMMAASKRTQKEHELQREVMELQQTYVGMQRELMAKEGQLTQQIGDRLKKVIGKIGDKEGYTMILNIADTVLYYKRHLDITDEVVRAYNKTYGNKKLAKR